MAIAAVRTHWRWLATDLGKTHQAIKTTMRWTGASERGVKHWFAGARAPSGQHLVALMQHSDTVLARIMHVAGRRDLIVGLGIVSLRLKLRELLTLIEEQIDLETELVEPQHFVPDG